MNEPLVILFLCTGNSCRSQMAEGFARYYNTLYKGDCEFYSAGLEAHGLNPRAVQVMEEAGVSISHHTSDFVSLSLIARSDIIITLCGLNADGRGPEQRTGEWYRTARSPGAAPHSAADIHIPPAAGIRIQAVPAALRGCPAFGPEGGDNGGSMADNPVPGSV